LLTTVLAGAVGPHHGLVLSSWVVDRHRNHHNGAVGTAQAVFAGRPHQQAVGPAMAMAAEHEQVRSTCGLHQRRTGVSLDDLHGHDRSRCQLRQRPFDAIALNTLGPAGIGGRLSRCAWPSGPSRW
jgi:hypothetical protein